MMLLVAVRWLVGLALVLATVSGATADEPAPELTPAQRAALEQEAKRMSEEAKKHYESRRYAEAVKIFEQVVATNQKLYPEAKYPDGHPDLAASLNSLGSLLRSMGAPERALPHQERALAMRQRLYPEAQY